MSFYYYYILLLLRMYLVPAAAFPPVPYPKECALFCDLKLYNSKEYLNVYKKTRNF